MKAKKPKKMDAQTLLKAFTASAKITVQPQWQEAADAVLENGIVSANAWSITVPKKKGTESFDIEDQWWEGLYKFIAPSLEPSETVMLAKAILQNKLLRAGCNEWSEWDTAWRLLRQSVGNDEEGRLLQLVNKKGFEAIAKAMTKHLATYLRSNPRIRATPQWDGHVLKWKSEEWTFRNQKDGSCKAVLEFVQAHQWKPGIVASLLPSQLQDAAKYLRKKTRPVIEWKASDDGYIIPVF